MILKVSRASECCLLNTYSEERRDSERKGVMKDRQIERNKEAVTQRKRESQKETERKRKS